ncbi:hypothetical protein O181_089101 [Austropuccinia psidii MF-1]|uniref:Uncharacterized protein n=1 Tax=Austropuccinia psidii MF-1 TaxID=1389203 RepID=A0A9Q3ISU1_9BASI|nr:hypothetical protein [Austropuccinia psidii MF-1]
MISGDLQWKALLKKPFSIFRGTGPCPGFLKKARLTALHPDMSETVLHERILRNCGGDLENAIRRIFIKPFSTEYYINAMEDITTRTKIGRNWYKPPMDNEASGKLISRPNKPQDRAPLKSHKFESTSHLSDTCSKKTGINKIEIEKAEYTKETKDLSLHKSDSKPSEEELLYKLSIKNINIFF